MKVQGLKAPAQGQYLTKLARLISVVLSLFLTGCGFHPLYEIRPDGNFTELADVWIETIPNRDGQILRNTLMTLINPYGAPKKPRYILKITLIETSSSLGILKDATASQTQYLITAHFELLNKNPIPSIGMEASSKPLLSSVSRGIANYNVIAEHPFSTITESNFAREKILQSMAQDIRNQIASYFLLREKVVEGSPQEQEKARAAMEDIFKKNPKEDGK